MAVTSAPIQVPARVRARIGAGGRLVIPAELRRQLGLDEGVAVVMRVEDGELRLLTVDESIRGVQERLKPYRGVSPSIVDEFIADRHAEAARE